MQLYILNLGTTVAEFRYCAERNGFVPSSPYDATPPDPDASLFAPFQTVLRIVPGGQVLAVSDNSDGSRAADWIGLIMGLLASSAVPIAAALSGSMPVRGFLYSATGPMDTRAITEAYAAAYGADAGAAMADRMVAATLARAA